MELTERQKRILSVIVEHHISTGEPLGSKQLAGLLENSPSSATLRNEMSYLCDAGLLSQPHTSAGRLPTSNGYRLYVNRLMKEDEVDTVTKGLIDGVLKSAADDSQNLPNVASKLLSKITGLPALSAVVGCGSAYVKKVQIIPLGNKVFVMVLLVSDGRVRTRICRSREDIEPKTTDLFYKIVEKHIIKRPLSELTPAAVQNILAFAGLEALTLATLFNHLASLLKTVCDSKIDFNGESNVFSMLGEEEKAKKLLSFIERKDAVVSLLSNVSEPIAVVFGPETSHSELNSSAVIIASYNVGPAEIGKIAVIGPTRMSYEQIIPSTKYLAAKLSSLMQETTYDMEEI